MLKKEFEFVLQDELIYSQDGKAKIVAEMLFLRAPTTKLLHLTMKLSSIVMKALMKARENYKNEKETSEIDSSPSDVDGEGIYALVSSSFVDEEQIEVFACLFTELLLSKNICLVDGKVELTKDLLNSLDPREVTRLIGEYIANFLLPSIMNQSKKKK